MKKKIKKRSKIVQSFHLSIYFDIESISSSVQESDDVYKLFSLPMFPKINAVPVFALYCPILLSFFQCIVFLNVILLIVHFLLLKLLRFNSSASLTLNS